MSDTAYLLILIIIFSLCLHSNGHTVLQRLNENFRMTYSQTRLSKLSTIEPLIICNGDDVTIIHRGSRVVERVIPKIYHNLKSISHIPLSIYLKLMFIEGNLSEEKSNELKTYLRAVHAIRPSIQFPVDLLQNQYDIIDLSIKFMRNILKRRSVDQPMLKMFCQHVEKYINMNIDAAARAQIDMLFDKIEPWYRIHFNQTERQTVKILILGPKTPRHGHLEKMFFYRLLGEYGEGTHIIYVENIDNEEKALEILGTWYLDEDISTEFFNDHHRLHRDLLGDAANTYIQRFYNTEKNVHDHKSYSHRTKDL